MRERLIRCSAVLLLMLALGTTATSQRAHAAVRKPTGWTTVRDTVSRIALDLPPGYHVRRLRDLQSLPDFEITGPVGPDAEIRLARPGVGYWDRFGDSMPPSMSDSLSRYVLNEAFNLCMLDGPDGEYGADSILSARRTRSPHGHEVFELMMRMSSTHAGYVDYDHDSTFTVDSAAFTETYSTMLVWAVDLSNTGAPRVVWMLRMCGEGLPELPPPLRLVARSIRRLGDP